MNTETPSQYEKGVEQGIAWGQQDEREAVIAWLRGNDLQDIAQCIEDKEHLE